MESGSGNPRSSFFQSRRQKFPLNASTATHHRSKVSTFSQRVTPPPTTGSNNNASTSDFNDDDSSFGVLLGTCSYMCPGKLIPDYFVLLCVGFWRAGNFCFEIGSWCLTAFLSGGLWCFSGGLGVKGARLVWS
ncbi:hypothetical protein MtrunA17_Chr8g0354601 [Medicago truncatula]|uniref:Uncharacterized protein n=1 Tax=Medicago truncatula TaxID=3880 RepID=G7LJ69_MEDTR|nr:uncharacterized protein LOC11409757 [Medicago truncatula]AET02555.1 hypothetical protein MTR_8g042200 [Medicago truncatula]RHN40426.1 hypothetical protein MtrunA17_Chr8g0354601 [Medicago truncatula]